MALNAFLPKVGRKVGEQDTEVEVPSGQKLSGENPHEGIDQCFSIPDVHK